MCKSSRRGGGGEPGGTGQRGLNSVPAFAVIMGRRRQVLLFFSWLFITWACHFLPWPTGLVVLSLSKYFGCSSRQESSESAGSPLADRAQPRPSLLWILNSLVGLLLLLLSLLFRQRTCPKRSSSNACSDQEVSANGFSNFCFSLSYWLLHCLSDDVYWGMFWVVERDPELRCRYQWAPAGGAKSGEWKQQPLCQPGAGG